MHPHSPSPASENSVAMCGIAPTQTASIAPDDRSATTAIRRHALANIAIIPVVSATCCATQAEHITKNSETVKSSSVKGLHSFGADNGQTVAVRLDDALQAERDILPLLVRAAIHSIDRDLIQRGIAAGWVPSHNSAAAGEPKDTDISIGWLRFRAACARAERTLYAQDDPMRRYLSHRAADSDAEANARARSMETMRRRVA